MKSQSNHTSHGNTMNQVNQFICRLLGLHPLALSYCDPQTQKAYLNQGKALVFVSILAIATGIELGINYTDNVILIIASGFLLSGLVFTMDYFLLSTMQTNAIGVISRLLFSMTIVIISAVSILLLINEKDIRNHFSEQDQSAIDQLDKDYADQKAGRYSYLVNLKEARQEYYNKVVHPEALNIYAGPEYQRKKLKFDEDGVMIEREERKLDSLEVAHYNYYQGKREIISAENAPGIFEKVQVCYEIVSTSVIKIIFAILIFVFLFGLEISALLAKFSLSKENDYLQVWLPKVISNENAASERHLDSIVNAKKTTIENDSIIGYRHDAINNMVKSQEDFIYESTKLKMLLAISEKHGNKHAAELAQRNLDSLVDLYSISYVSNPMIDNCINKKEIFRMTEAMRTVVLSIVKHGSNQKAIAEGVFAWMQTNIQYDESHSGGYYKTASETFNFRKGVCGEQTLLYMTLLRHAGINANYVHVLKDDKSANVNHACAQITIDNESFLSDPAYHQFIITHTEYEVMSDAELLANYIEWNK